MLSSLRPSSEFLIIPFSHHPIHSPSLAPLRAFRDEMRTFTQLFFLLVLYNIQPNTHTSDATTNVMGLIHYIHQGLEIDVAGIISSWMKEIVLSGHPDKLLKSAKVRAKSPLGYPCLIMGLCTTNKLTIPQIGSEEISIINDDYVDRHCKPKKKKRAAPPPQPPTQSSTSAATDQNFYNFCTYMYDQNDAGYRAMTAVHESIYRGGGAVDNEDAADDVEGSAASMAEGDGDDNDSASD
ncbi:hypothetical protein L195_g030072 [Trifolium pratense]|uniref:Uncharacterized protein n=1 Tax=Trifolium pratense TaxID=57577 RepID=A0A2K3L6K3_TRIPR|nr:hypothetical protein L195_g030072 [Trifolium pratense]